MTSDSTLVEHATPTGFSVWSRESDHSYWGAVNLDANGEVKGASDRWAGYSTVSKAVDFYPDGLMNWAARLDREGIAELASITLAEAPDNLGDALAWLTTAESILEALTDAGLMWQDLRKRAATRGTNIHEQFFAAMCRGERVPSLKSASHDERAYAQGVLAFFRDHKVEAEHIEQVVADPDNKVAGRLDFRGQLDGVATLLDLKTGTFDSVTHHVQIAGYELGAQASGYGETDQQMILRVDGESNYALVPGVCTPAEFEVVLANYRLNKALNKRARDQRKAAG